MLLFPMWKTIYRGNWARTNEFIYQMVGVLEEEEIMVYGGASGEFIFVSESGFFTDTRKKAYLDDKDNKLPIPKHFWKFVYNRNKNQVNDPLFNKYASYKPLCEEVTDGLKPDWSLNHEDGYSYMCKPSHILNENLDEIKIWKSDWTPWHDSSIGFLSLSSKENQSKLKTFFAYFGTAMVGAAGAALLLA
ncbi:hypothetical protein TSAR_005472 [Trichomalopsis sarcophagae]|uniref:DNA/RNA non-specific endonuclease domain-containing protein n=1 Tax=Trichomalopsis sarcophagae TaxID=543379 RepID=A0A232FDF0_9HYME|nr:hypothetical protein TSAR_005472 [Trichomalopsis sarcophagae]